jgi:hypothetical protein
VLVYWLTDSRAGAVALAICLAAFHAVLANPGRMKTVGTAAAVGASILVVGAIVFEAGAGHEFLGGRSVVWHQAYSAILTHPGFGVGLGNFQDLRLGHVETMATRWYAAHNLYLQLLTEVGVLGCLWLWLVLRVAIWARSSAPSSLDQCTRAGLFASVLFLIIHGAIDYSPAMPFNAVVVAAAAGLLAGIRPRLGPFLPVRPLARPGTAAVIAVAAALTATSVQYAYSEVRVFATRDAVARLVAEAGRRDRDASRLRAAIDSHERNCTVMPPRKDDLLASAYAQLLLPEAYSTSGLREASTLLRSYQSIGRLHSSLLPLQAEVARRSGSP